jgi:hypothetical protein
MQAIFILRFDMHAAIGTNSSAKTNLGNQRWKIEFGGKISDS